MHFSTIIDAELKKEVFNLKRIIFVSLLSLFITANFALADLTKEDLREIKTLLDEQEKRIKEYIDIKIETVNARIGAVEKTLNARIDTVERTMNSKFESVENGQEFLKWMIGIVALVVVAGIAFPPIWQEWRERKSSSLTQRVLKLEQEVAELKKRMVLYKPLEGESVDGTSK